ncbi:MAG: hypothetical protein ACYS0K_18100 [Planctomycetota bacterium]|jgi:hypothetical protein
MRVAGVALALSVVALAVAVIAPTQESPPPQRAPMRTDHVAALETQVAELKREVESLKAEKAQRIGIGRDTSRPLAETRPTDVDDGGSPPAAAKDDPALTEIIDDAVDRKTKQVLDELRIKADKKPAMKAFASALELTQEQRAAAERVVVDGQRQVHAILDTPTDDGTNLMDELVEVVARGFAQPGKDQGFGRWIARVLSEKIPGTDETYAVRIESVKTAMRATFKRDWSEAQYQEFEEWGVDPTEIQKVPGSPNELLEKRVVERARRLGAEIPDGG